MKYRVLKDFTDLQDNRYLYKVGDTYPRNGLSVTAERIAELSSKSNRQRVPLIEEVQEQPEKDEPAEDAPKKRGRKSDK